MIRPSLLLGTVTALYFVPEIFQYSHHAVGTIVLAYLIQVLHDAVCVYLFALFLRCAYTRLPIDLCRLNIMHTIIVGLFCYYKRCVLTLWYNHVLGIEMCTRYIPIWQRTVNLIGPSSCPPESWQTTYLWLNNHILQTMLVLTANVLQFHQYRYLSKKHLK